MAKASARHILVEDEAFCKELIEKITQGEAFADLAKAHSKCPLRGQGR